MAEPEDTDTNDCRSVVLVGFMGSGKTVVGRELARKLQCRLFDTDRELELQFGKPIPLIFSSLGEAAFRRAETEWLRQLVAETPQEVLGSQDGRMILSTGGGTPLGEENATLLRRIGAVVYLEATPVTIYERVRSHLDQRPLLASYAGDPISRIEQLLHERQPIYRSVADIRVDSLLSRRASEVADEIIERLGLYVNRCQES